MSTKRKPRRSYNKLAKIPQPNHTLNGYNLPVFRGRKGFSEQDLIVCLMGKVGFSGHCISKQTGLSVREVYRVLSKEKIKLWDYRHGRQWGRTVVAACLNRVREEGKLIS